MRPVPLVPLTLRVRTIRPGRKVQWIEAALLDDDDREVARATVLRLRTAEVDTTGSVGIVADAPPPGREPAETRRRSSARATSASGARTTCASCAATGWSPGPGIAWLRLRCPVVAGEELSPCSRVAAAADFGSGVGNPLRYTHASGSTPTSRSRLHRHPVERMGLPRVGRMGGTARCRARRDSPARRARADRPGRADVARRVDRRAPESRCVAVAKTPVGASDRVSTSSSSTGLRSTSAASNSNSPLRNVSIAGRPGERRAEVAAAHVDADRDRPPARGGEHGDAIRRVPLERRRRQRERLIRRELLLLAGPALQRLLDPIGDRLA